MNRCVSLVHLTEPGMVDKSLFHDLLLMVAVCFLVAGCQAVRFCGTRNSSTRPRCC